MPALGLSKESWFKLSSHENSYYAASKYTSWHFNPTHTLLAWDGDSFHICMSFKGTKEGRKLDIPNLQEFCKESKLETQPSSLHWHKTACLTPIQDLVKARGTRRWQVINKPPDAQTACVVMRLNHHHQMQMKGTLVTHRINQTISFPRVQFLVNPVSDWTNSEN